MDSDTFEQMLNEGPEDESILSDDSNKSKTSAYSPGKSISSNTSESSNEMETTDNPDIVKVKKEGESILKKQPKQEPSQEPENPKSTSNRETTKPLIPEQPTRSQIKAPPPSHKSQSKPAPDSRNKKKRKKGKRKRISSPTPTTPNPSSQQHPHSNKKARVSNNSHFASDNHSLFDESFSSAEFFAKPSAKRRKGKNPTSTSHFQAIPSIHHLPQSTPTDIIISERWTKEEAERRRHGLKIRHIRGLQSLGYNVSVAN